MIMIEFNQDQQKLRLFHPKYSEEKKRGYYSLMICKDFAEATLILDYLYLIIEIGNVSFEYLKKMIAELINFSIEYKIYRDFKIMQFENN